MKKNVLVVDDDVTARELLAGILRRSGFEVESCSSAEEALERLRASQFPVVLSDIQMFAMGGIALVTELRKMGSQALVILITGHGSLAGAVEALHEGAFDYLSKPVKPDELVSVVERAFRQFDQPLDTDTVKGAAELDLPEKTLIGQSPRMVQVYKMLAKASMCESNVLITGESGTGKELVARAIRDNGILKNKPFVTVNCGALAETLLESELFGHAKGAFTGAITAKRGLFDEADGGTIFLDEIGDISPALQVKLLRVLQEGEFKPVGSNETRQVRVRLITATHRDLDQAVREGRFREDLLYRLKVILIDIPPLRQRIEDLDVLVKYFVQRYGRLNQKNVVGVSREAMQRLASHQWPGNIRELENAIERAVAMTNTSILDTEDFPRELFGYTETVNLGPVVSVFPPALRGELETGLEVPAKSLEAMERAHIIKILEEERYNKSRAAQVLGIDRATLYRKAQRYGIRLGEGRTSTG